MSLSIGEQVKIIMKRQGVSLTELAEKMGQSRQNLSNKMRRDNFTESEAIAMASILGCKLSITFTLPDGSTLTDE